MCVLTFPWFIVTVAHFGDEQGLAVDFVYYFSLRSIRAITLSSTKEAPGSAGTVVRWPCPTSDRCLLFGCLHSSHGHTFNSQFLVSIVPFMQCVV